MLYEALQKENMASDQDLDLDDITTTGPSRCPTTPNQKSKPLENPPPIGGLSLNQLQEKANQVITYEWVSGLNDSQKNCKIKWTCFQWCSLKCWDVSFISPLDIVPLLDDFNFHTIFETFK